MSVPGKPSPAVRVLTAQVRALRKQNKALRNATLDAAARVVASWSSFSMPTGAIADAVLSLKDKP